MKIITIIFCFVFSISSYCQTLLIGSSKYNPPFETWTAQQKMPYGYDIDFMNEVCKRLHATCEYKPYSFDELFVALEQDKVDLVISSIIISAYREDEFLFSLPYLESNAQFLTYSNSPISSFKDLSGKKIGIRSGTPYDYLLRSDNNKFTVVYYPQIEDMLVALSTKQIDACIIDYEAAKYWIATNPGIYKLIGGKLLIGNGYAIMANKDKKELIQQINRIILQMEADGTYLKLYNQYF